MDCDAAAVQPPGSCTLPRNQSGAILLSVLIACLAFSCLAASIFLLTSHTTMTTVRRADAMHAYYLALSGLNLWTDGRTGAFDLGDGRITLSQSAQDADGAVTVTSIGTVNAESGQEVNMRVAAKRQVASTITFAADIDSFKTPILGKTTNDSEAIVVFGKNVAAAPDKASYADWVSLLSQQASRYADGWIRLGGGASSTTAAVWYDGDKGACTAGKCVFSKGIRAYFGFTIDGYDASHDSREQGDGFTFAVITAAGNDPSLAAGGPDSGKRGEYLGYAGPGPSGEGIKAPKMAIEVDTYPNKGSGEGKAANSRRDKSDANHVAVVYWGDAASIYDDNTHGVGTAPQNPVNTGPGYHEQAASVGGANWLEDGEEHAMRVEIHRDTEGGEGAYTVLAWIDPTGAGKDDVTVDFTAQPPQVSSTVRLSAADHAKLDAVYFGWTEATGGETQTVAIHDFALAFRR